MTRWAFVIGPGRSGTTLLSHLLNRSSSVFIAPETKYFQQVWSQRHLLRLMPRGTRVRRIVDHLVASEYPADPPMLPSHRDELLGALSRAPGLDAAFLELIRTLSDRPVLGEKTPWHTFFVDRIRRVAPDARFLAITRDAPATVASTWGRSGFRRVDTLAQCIGRWIFMNRELVEVRKRLGAQEFRLIRFEDLLRSPEPVMRDVCSFLDVRFEEAMVDPSFQDSSLRRNDTGGGLDTGAVDRWKDSLAQNDVRLIRAHTWRLSRELGYTVDPEDARLRKRLAIAAERAILRAAVALMRSGLYPFGAATRTQQARSSAG